MEKIEKIEISVVMLVYNSETTVLESLESIKKQDYKVKEIIVIDNHSTDNSIKIVEDFKKKNKNLEIIIIKREKTHAVSASYNLGAKLARGNYLVTYHSDSSLPTNQELRKLLMPFLEDPTVVASGSITILPEDIWNKYGFWQKYVYAGAAGREVASGNCKFDCYKKDVFLRIGGCDEINFGGKDHVGGEDADLHIRLRQVGKVALSKGKVIHLHYMGTNYSLRDVIKNKWRLSRAYGRVLRIRGKQLTIKSISLLLAKPALGILPLIPYFHALGIVLLILYSFAYSQKMFLTRSTHMDFRILVVPLLNIFLIYYETFCMMRTFFIINKDK
ncbi:MAG: glycosyltransferase [Patescibacteria group bacterium]